MPILTDLRASLDAHYNTFRELKNLKREERLEFFRVTIEQFVKKANPQSFFSAWRSYILDNYPKFLYKDDDKEFNMIIRLALKRFGNIG